LKDWVLRLGISMKFEKLGIKAKNWDKIGKIRHLNLKIG